MIHVHNVETKKTFKKSRDKVAVELKRVWEIRSELRIHKALAKGVDVSDLVDTRRGRVTRQRLIAYLEFSFRVAIGRVCRARRELFKEVAATRMALKCESKSCD